MDAKERHELKDNDLAEFLQNFGDFWSKSGNTVMIIIMLGLAVFVGYRWYSNQQVQAHEYAWSDLAIRSTPTGYRDSAAEAKGFEPVQAQALLRGATLFHEQALKAQAEESQQDTSLMSPEESLDNATKMFKQALDSDFAPIFRANAALGLANVSETRGDFEAAKGYWEQAKKIAEDASLTAIAKQAQVRLDLTESISEPITLADSPAAEAPAVPELKPDSTSEATEDASAEAETEAETDSDAEPQAAEPKTDAGP